MSFLNGPYKPIGGLPETNARDSQSIIEKGKLGDREVRRTKSATHSRTVHRGTRNPTNKTEHKIKAELKIKKGTSEETEASNLNNSSDARHSESSEILYDLSYFDLDDQEDTTPTTSYGSSKTPDTVSDHIESDSSNNGSKSGIGDEHRKRNKNSSDLADVTSDFINATNTEKPGTSHQIRKSNSVSHKTKHGTEKDFYKAARYLKKLCEQFESKPDFVKMQNSQPYHDYLQKLHLKDVPNTSTLPEPKKRAEGQAETTFRHEIISFPHKSGHSPFHKSADSLAKSADEKFMKAELRRTNANNLSRWINIKAGRANDFEMNWATQLHERARTEKSAADEIKKLDQGFERYISDQNAAKKIEHKLATKIVSRFEIFSADTLREFVRFTDRASTSPNSSEIVETFSCYPRDARFVSTR
jgi:hypothetical protein